MGEKDFFTIMKLSTFHTLTMSPPISFVWLMFVVMWGLMQRLIAGSDACYYCVDMFWNYGVVRYLIFDHIPGYMAADVAFKNMVCGTS